jgi:hypothetical protein
LKINGHKIYLIVGIALPAERITPPGKAKIGPSEPVEKAD